MTRALSVDPDAAFPRDRLTVVAWSYLELVFSTASGRARTNRRYPRAAAGTRPKLTHAFGFGIPPSGRDEKVVLAEIASAQRKVAIPRGNNQRPTDSVVSDQPRRAGNFKAAQSQTEGSGKVRRKCLNLACGKDYVASTADEEWTNADIAPSLQVDLRLNALEFPYPIEDESFDYFKVFDFIEHVPHVVFNRDGGPFKKDGFLVFMEELWRIGKPGAMALFNFPAFFSLHNWRDPTHTRRIMRANWEKYMTPTGKYNFYTDRHWRVVHYRTGIPALYDGQCLVQKLGRG
jgi:SAM-dependent methyltransferase